MLSNKVYFQKFADPEKKIRVNSAFTATILFNHAAFIANPLPSSNQYLYETVCLLLTLPEFKEELKNWLGEQYEIVMYEIHKQAKINHASHYIEELLGKCNTMTEVQVFIQQVLRDELLRVSSVSAQINCPLLQVYTMLLYISDVSNKSLSADWVHMMRKGKGSFMNDPRFQKLNIYQVERTEEKTEE